MSAECWTDSLKQTLTSLRTYYKERPLRVALVGIGHELRGDDAVGLVVAQQLRPLAHEQLLIVEGGHAPENHTGSLRRFTPNLVILVDCALLNERPGAIRWLPWQETTGLSASTHTMPPYMLAAYLTASFDCDIALIGIQPADTTLGSPLSEPVQEAVRAIVEVVKLNFI